MSDEIEIIAVGDIMLGDHPVKIGHGMGRTIKEKGAEFPFQKVASILRRADITIGNLETVLSNANITKGAYRSMQLRGTSSSVDGLVYAGFNVLSLANNHILQHGEEAFYETICVLESRGLKYVGLSEADNHCKPTIIGAKNKKIGFLAYSFRPEIYYKLKSFYAVGEISKIEEDILKIKNKVDIVVVSLHWGDEFINRPSPEQRTFARRIIDAGAKIVLGHHPHILQGIERYHHGIIAYSLGNFVSDMWQKKLRESMVLKCKFLTDSSIDIEIIPLFINDSCQPEILESGAAKRFLSYIESLSEELQYGDVQMDKESQLHYERDLRKCEKQFSKELKKYFISNIWKYSISMIYQILADVMKKRIK